MNEQIKTMWEEATGSVWPRPGKFTAGENEANLTKFAELIVGECIGCCEQVISDPVPESVDTWSNGGLQCIDEIKQHFGIEE